MKNYAFLRAIGFSILALFLNCNRTDESFPSLNNLLIELSPTDGQAFVPTHAEIKAVINKISHEHSNDLGIALLKLNLSLYSESEYIEGNVEFIEGEAADTLIFNSTAPLPTQQEFELSFSAHWVIGENSIYGEPYNIAHTFETVPSSLPKNSVKKIYPDNNSSNISVFAQPSIDFIYPINEELQLVNDTYKYTIKNISISTSTSEIEGELVWNDKNDQLIFKPNNSFPTNSEITVNVESQLLILANGNWQDAESSVVYATTFITEDAESKILLSDSEIENSYPINRQYNFHKDEYNKGYIKLKTSYSWLDDLQATYSVDFILNNGDIISSKEVVYSNENRWFEYNLPTNLENNTIYKIALNRNENEKKHSLYEFTFKTSAFNTFQEKISALNIDGNYIDRTYYNGVYCLAASLTGEEHFDMFELLKEPFNIGDFTIYKSTGLIQCEADTSDSWYSNGSINAVYSILKNGDMALEYRDNQFFDIPPTRAIYMSCDEGDDIMLTDEEIESNEIVGFQDFFSSKILYDQNIIMYTDYYDLSSRITNMAHSEKTDEMEFLTLHPFPSMLGASDYTFNVKLKYVIPCIETVSSELEITIFE